MNSNMCYGKGGPMDAPVIPSLRRPQLGSTALMEEVTSPADESTISQRLFGRFVSLGTQVCKGPCVDDGKLALAFASHS